MSWNNTIQNERCANTNEDKKERIVRKKVLDYYFHSSGGLEDKQ